MSHATREIATTTQDALEEIDIALRVDGTEHRVRDLPITPDKLMHFTSGECR